VEWLRVSASAPEPAALERAASVLQAGGIVLYPTDTLYGLAVDPRLPGAVGRLLTLKGRPQGQPLPLIAASPAQAGVVVALDESAALLAGVFWPGPLTLVADARPALAPGVAGTDGTAAIRVPDHAVARGVAEALGFPITSTSANPSGGEASAAAREAAASLGGDVDLVLDAGPTPGGPPSTIVDARGIAPRLLRAGAIPFERILEATTPR
jgi:L-threonylcarbamoyladenylate synthase